ncbi:MAG: hypothetical protein KKB70_05795 [Proteobacteria bacterium]|nr:hypothetical protein [Pseudomonadota bacterium]
MSKFKAFKIQFGPKLSVTVRALVVLFTLFLLAIYALWGAHHRGANFGAVIMALFVLVVPLWDWIVAPLKQRDLYSVIHEHNHGVDCHSFCLRKNVSLGCLDEEEMIVLAEALDVDFEPEEGEKMEVFCTWGSGSPDLSSLVMSFAAKGVK